VALLEEALELRAARIRIPILLLGPVIRSQLPLAASANLSLGIVGPTQLRDARDFVTAEKRKLSIQLKLDTGMGRMGFLDSDLYEVAEILLNTPALKLEAIYTHYANASDPRDPFTEEQRARFSSMLEQFRSAGITAPVHHSANSPATMRGLVAPGDLARVGMSLYGGEVMDVGSARLEPVMRWRSEIARVKELPAGSTVGYGRAYRMGKVSRIATLPVGYADGFSRLLSNNGEVLLHGRRVPVVGRVSMDLVTIDVTGVENAAVGDEVILLGRQGEDEISAEEHARKTGKIAYEVFCRIGARVPRVYISAKEQRVRSKFLDILARHVS
jgi:alanine racemase